MAHTMSEPAEDVAQLLRDHLTNLPPVSKRVAERAIAELERLRKIADQGASQELPRQESAVCARCAEAEHAVAALLAVFRRDNFRERVEALREIRDLTEKLLRSEAQILRGEPEGDRFRSLLHRSGKEREGEMGIHILEGRDGRGALLYCSTTDWGFGPLFDDGEDAEDFCAWHAERTSEDLRTLGDSALEAARSEWLAIRDAWRQARDGEHAKACCVCDEPVAWGKAHLFNSGALDEEDHVEVVCSARCTEKAKATRTSWRVTP